MKNFPEVIPVKMQTLPPIDIFISRGNSANPYERNRHFKSKNFKNKKQTK